MNSAGLCGHNGGAFETFVHEIRLFQLHAHRAKYTRLGWIEIIPIGMYGWFVRPYFAQLKESSG
jgi:hypothetical protein